jgi:hypothetical protein
MKNSISKSILFILLLGGISSFILGAPFDPMDFIKEPHHNHSYSGGEAEVLRMAPRVLVWREGCWEKMEALCDGLAFDKIESVAQLLGTSNVIVIPTRGLSVSHWNPKLKGALEFFVALGGSLVVMNQQFGRYVEEFVPRGDELKVYCGLDIKKDRPSIATVEGGHPVMSSFAKRRADVAIDGYFAQYPSDATILARTSTDSEPVLICYPFGKGSVFLSCLYTDSPWCDVKLTKPEFLLIQNLISFASSPSHTIPQFDLRQTPAPSIEIEAEIKNHSRRNAHKARFTFYAANQATILYQMEIPATLSPGAQMTIPLTFTLGKIADSHLGICRGEYLLLDENNLQIQKNFPLHGGLFALYRKSEP